MAIAFLSSHSPIANAGTYTHNGSCGLIVLTGGAQSSSSAARTITAWSLTDGTNSVNVELDLVAQVTGGARISFAGYCRPHASWTAGATITQTLTWSGAMSGTASSDIMQFSLSSVSDPYVSFGQCENTNATALVWAVYPTITGVAVGDLLVVVAQKSGTGVGWAPIATPETYTEPVDLSDASGRRTTQYVIATGTGTYDTVLDPTTSASNAGTAIQMQFRENNDPSLTTATTEPFEPGETVTFSGTVLDAANAGARIRKVGGTNAFDALTGYSASSSTAATAVIANRPSRTPYTSEDGTTHTLEFISTKNSGASTSGVATAALTVNDFVPPAGFSRVTIATPDLSSDSLLSALGWTSVAGDQIEWDNTVNVSGTDVTITVNDDGTVALDSGVNPMPATVSFKWRAYSTVDEDWTGQASDTSDWATATFTSASSGGADSEFLFRRHRYLAFQRIGRFNP